MTTDNDTKPICEKQPFPEVAGTIDAATISDRYHHLAEFALDIDGAAQAFADLHGYGPMYEDVRPFPAFAYDTKAATWRVWEYDTGWTERASVLPEMNTIMAALCALEARRANDGDEKIETEYRKLRQRHLGGNVEKAIRLAAAYMTVDDWDADPMMFGMPNAGVSYCTPSNSTNPVHQLDQEAADHITRKLGATPAVMTPDVRRFLDWFTGGDLLYENALQVWLAASLLPGNVDDKAHILTGDGGTGKSTLLKAIDRAMGDYAGSARASVFVSEKDNHPAELLPFIEKRMVILPELPSGALRSDLLKTVTGGDSISVRGMRQNPRTETPQATLWFSANELPSIRMVDNALRRRLMIWPCDNKLETVDRSLRGVLQEPHNLAAWVGWLMVGLRKYCRLTAQGLDMPIPAQVAAATEEYFSEVDTVGLWCTACTEEEGEELASTLYKSYRGWCDTTNRRALGERSFGLWLTRHYEKRHTMSGNTYPLTIT